MDDLPVLNAWDLRDGPRCGERLRRRLNGNAGQFIGGARHSVLARLRGDIALAHSEMRIATPTDFPEPLDLLPEQIRLYDAATRGYQALFSDRAARSLDWEKSRELQQHGVHFRMNPGIACLCDDDTYQLRRIQTSGRVPTIDQSLLYSLAILWEHNLSGLTLQIVAADVVAIEMQSVELNVDSVIEDAKSWFANRVNELRAVASEGRIATGNECADCQYVWDCPAHRSARR